MNTRRDFVRGLSGLGAIIATGHAPAAIVRSMVAVRGAMMGKTGWKNPYVTDGLIAMWDGEWNVGGGVHDTSAVSWLNLAGDPSFDMTVPAYWDANSLVMDGSFCPKAPKSRLVNITIECVCSGTSKNLLSFGWAVQSGMRRSLLQNASVLRAYQNVGANFDGTRKPNARSFALTIGGAGGTIYTDGVLNVFKSFAPVAGETASAYRLGGYGAGSDGETDLAGYNYIGNIYRASIYSRDLTAAEIAANHAVDVARFSLPTA